MMELFLISEEYNQDNLYTILVRAGFNLSDKKDYDLQREGVYIDLSSSQSSGTVRVMGNSFHITSDYQILEQLVEILDPERIVDSCSQPKYQQLLKQPTNQREEQVQQQN